MRVVYSHQLGKEEARARLERIIPEMLAQYGHQVLELEYTWSGETMRYSFRAAGRNISGTLTMNESEVVLEMELPFMARPFEGSIKRRIIAGLDGLL